MSSVPTVVLQLTTTFTAPAECFNTPWVVNNVPTTWWKVGGDLVASCFPPAFPFSISSILYSPGICPAGWTSACQRQATLGGAKQNIVSCCPSSFQCKSTLNAQRPWERNFGCASPYPFESGVWGVTPGSPMVESIYQQHIMIVESTTSSSLLSSATTTPSPASGVTPLPSPTDQPTAPPESASKSSAGLSSGAIAGVAIGGVVGVAIIALLAYIAWIIRRKHRANAAGPPLATPYSDDPMSVLGNRSHAHSYTSPYRESEPVELDQGPQVYELKAQPVYEMKAH